MVLQSTSATPRLLNCFTYGTCAPVRPRLSGAIAQALQGRPVYELHVSSSSARCFRACFWRCCRRRRWQWRSQCTSSCQCFRGCRRPSRLLPAASWWTPAKPNAKAVKSFLLSLFCGSHYAIGMYQEPCLSITQYAGSSQPCVCMHSTRCLPP